MCCHYFDLQINVPFPSSRLFADLCESSESRVTTLDGQVDRLFASLQHLVTEKNSTLSDLQNLRAEVNVREGELQDLM